MGNQQKEPKAKILNPTELQTYIMVTQVKLNQGRNKKIALIKKKQDEIIKNLNDNNLDIAKAKMESLMREEDYITVYDILGPLCEILKEKVTYIMTSKECPADLRASLDTLIYSSTRLEIEELHFIREFIKQKFTNIYVDKANSNIDKLVNINVVDKLTVKPYPEAELICRLKTICERENIQFSFPQLANPLIMDPNLNNKNVVIPTIPNFNNMDNHRGNNMGNYPSGTGGFGYPYPNNNDNNLNMNMNNTGNGMSGYGMPMGNNFPQGNVSYPGTQYPAQYSNFPNNQIQPNVPQHQQVFQNFSTIDNKNQSNLNSNYDASANSSFSNIPNNFSAGNITHYPSQNQNANMQPSGMNFPSNYGNNMVIPPMNNINNDNGFPTMLGGNDTFPQGKENVSPMISGGFPPMTNNNQINNTNQMTKPEENNNGFPTMGTGTQITPNNSSQNFHDVNNPNYANVFNLEFPNSKKN